MRTIYSFVSMICYIVCTIYKSREQIRKTSARFSEGTTVKGGNEYYCILMCGAPQFLLQNVDSVDGYHFFLYS